MHSAMAPGPLLDQMTEAMLTTLLPEVNALAAGNGEGTVVDLFRWIRRAFSISSTVYGPGNPFAKQHDFEELFWNYDEGLAPLLFGMPTPSARKAHSSRALIIKAMNEYFERSDYKNGLGVLKMRYKVGKKYGATDDDLSRLEVGDLIGILINATPTLFWSLLHIYSDPALLVSLREEVDAQMARPAVRNSKMTHTIDITTLQEMCPLLLSTFHEVLRYHTHNSTARWVKEDTLLANRYLLKKDTVVLIPGGVVHAYASLWGEDVSRFNPRRFLKQDSESETARLHPGAYRAWGGGQTLCPGRFFATAEITSALAMFVARYDITPVNGKGWIVPKTKGDRVVSSIHPPSTDVKVKITTRKGFQGHEWKDFFGHEKDHEHA